MSLSAESSFSGPPTDSSSNLASSDSTPPTTVADTESLHSDVAKHDVITVAVDSPPPESVEVNIQVSAPPATRVRRSRVSAPIYNESRLSGTSRYAKRESNGDAAVTSRRRRTIAGDVASRSPSKSTRSASRAAREAMDASDSRRSPRSSQSPRTARHVQDSPQALRASRQAAAPLSHLGSKLAALGKRKRKAPDAAPSKMSRELMRLQDTKEFAHQDDKPVYHTVWSNGKWVDPNAPTPPPRKKAKVEEPKEEPEKDDSEPITRISKRRPKKYLEKGLYAGQDAPLDIYKGLTPTEKKKLAQLPELIPSGRVNKTMPLPLYTGLRMLVAGRDFKLPYQVCNPLPPGQPKPDEWKKMTKNRFIGESKDYWRKSPHFPDYMSKCVCKRDDGCGESCQNRIMLYECDDTNCNVGKEYCMNRAFASLAARRAKGGKYRVGVEVIKTSDRGYGVRSNRCFRPHQIIMEYAGEIITEEECERRMNEVYKHNDCYYLMSFDQNMIIDATSGSIARFVNHSCNPNCRMIKWIVAGQPRMALFAGDKPISTGDELTYDYNFDPFSAKNVQSCLCGEENCRGILGPRKSEVRPAKASIKTTVKKTVKSGKRKLKETIGGGGSKDGNGQAAKKRKIQPATEVKKAISKTSTKVVKNATAGIKKVSGGVATTLKKQKGEKTAIKKTAAVKKTTVKAKSPTKKSAAAKAPASKATAAAKTTTVKGARTKAVVSKTMTKKHVVTTYAKKKITPKKKAVVSTNMPQSGASLTIVAKGDATDLANKKRDKKKKEQKKTQMIPSPAKPKATNTKKQLTLTGFIKDSDSLGKKKKTSIITPAAAAAVDLLGKENVNMMEASKAVLA